MGFASLPIPKELKDDLAATRTNMETLVATLGRVEKLLAAQNELLASVLNDPEQAHLTGLRKAVQNKRRTA